MLLRLPVFLTKRERARLALERQNWREGKAFGSARSRSCFSTPGVDPSPSPSPRPAPSDSPPICLEGWPRGESGAGLTI